ncbi:Protein dimmed [Halotydeus destructor]|nr:Protein dimmed [Halotydeus destructor]
MKSRRDSQLDTERTRVTNTLQGLSIWKEQQSQLEASLTLMRKRQSPGSDKNGSVTLDNDSQSINGSESTDSSSACDGDSLISATTTRSSKRQRRTSGPPGGPHGAPTSGPGSSGGGGGGGVGTTSCVGRRRKSALNARERNLRRLESNERERMRMHSLNDAFQGLREVIPHVRLERKLSKIETLTLAKNYISALTNVVCDMRQETSPFKNGDPGGPDAKSPLSPGAQAAGQSGPEVDSQDFLLAVSKACSHLVPGDCEPELIFPDSPNSTDEKTRILFEKLEASSAHLLDSLQG